MSAPISDPVLARRAQIQRLVRIGKAVGYTLLLVAIVTFVVARLDEPRPIYTQLLAWTMGIASLLLAPAIVFGYAVGAAEREDRQRAAAKAERVAKAAKAADNTDNTDNTGAGNTDNTGARTADSTGE